MLSTFVIPSALEGLPIALYGFSLAAGKIKELLADLPTVSALFKKDIEIFLQKMEFFLLSVEEALYKITCREAQECCAAPS